VLAGSSAVETLLRAFGVGLAVALGVVFVLTVGRSVLATRPRRYERRRYPDLYGEIYRRSMQPDPDWDSFAASLSSRDRPVARSVLDTLLRTLRGRERRELQAAGRALGIAAEAREELKAGSAHEKRRALTWLTLLEEPLPPPVLWRYCRDDDETLAGAARLLFACGHPDARREGTELLFSDADNTLSAFGQDTLYRLYRSDATRLARLAGRKHGEWRPAFVIQVLTVLRYATPAHGGADLSWIYDLTEGPYREVRTAAVRALGTYGHRADVRRSSPIADLIGDPDPEIRKAAYLTLAEWGNAAAHRLLTEAAAGESDDRARLVAVRCLADADAEGLLEGAGTPDDTADLAATIEWVRAERAALEGSA
jgi:hypothetical protein